MGTPPDTSKVDTSACRAALENEEKVRQRPRDPPKPQEGVSEEMNRQARMAARSTARNERIEAREKAQEACGGVDLTCIETLKVEGQMKANKLAIPDSLQQTIDNCKKTGTPRAPKPGG